MITLTLSAPPVNAIEEWVRAFDAELDELGSVPRCTVLHKTMRACPQPIIAPIDSICAGAGAILAMRLSRPPGWGRTMVYTRN